MKLYFYYEGYLEMTAFRVSVTSDQSDCDADFAQFLSRELSDAIKRVKISPCYLLSTPQIQIGKSFHLMLVSQAGFISDDMTKEEKLKYRENLSLALQAAGFKMKIK